MNNEYQGRVVQIIGNVIDIEFAGGELPLINVALHVKRAQPDDQGRTELVAEVTPAGEARLGRHDPGLPPVELDLLDELAGRPRQVRDLGAPGQSRPVFQRAWRAD